MVKAKLALGFAHQGPDAWNLFEKRETHRSGIRLLLLLLLFAVTGHKERTIPPTNWKSWPRAHSPIRGGADMPSCERAHSPIGMADRAPDSRWAGSLSGGRTTDRDISARRMVWCQQRAGSPRQPLQACAGGQASENRPGRLELLLQLLLSWRDAMRSGY